jgi:hypothetical protein
MEVDDYPEADRREVNPPIEVESATWSAGGTLDWWVKERREWFGRVRRPTVRQSGSKPMIFARRKRSELAQPFSGRSGSWVIQYGVSGVLGVVNRALTTHNRPAATVAVEGTSRPGSVISPSTTPLAN